MNYIAREKTFCGHSRQNVIINGLNKSIKGGVLSATHLEVAPYNLLI